MAWDFGTGRIQFYRSLANSAKGAVPLSRVLELLIQGKPGIPADAVRGIQRTLGQGPSFATALERQPGVFPAWEVQMIRVAEMTGRLDTAFVRIAMILEERRTFLFDLIGKLAYPMLLLHLAPFILNAPLLFQQEGSVTAYALAVLMWLLGCDVPVVAVWLALKFRLISFQKLPLGQMMAKGQFCSILAGTVRAGAPFYEALEMAATASAVPIPTHAAIHGKRISDCLRTVGIFTPEEMADFEVAELSGALDETLERHAAQTQEKCQAMVKSFTALLAPISLLGIGILMAYRIIKLYASVMPQ